MTELLKKAYDPESFRKNAHELVDILADHLAYSKTDDSRVLPWQKPGDHYHEWKAYFEDGEFKENAAFWKKIVNQSIHIHDPKYMGHQVSVPALISGLAEMVNGLLNNGSAIYEMGPACNSMERVVIKWLTTAMGFGEQAEGFLTSGGSIGNLTALLAARQHQSDYNIWKEGSGGDFRPAVIVSKEAHYSVARSVQILGWGEDAIIHAPVDEDLALDANSLPQLYELAKQKGRQLIAVIGNACTTSTGSYDPLDRIADFCQFHHIWFHVDGAHGGAAAISPKYRHLAKGINRADSVVIDFHKMMGLSALTTALLFREPGPSYANFDQEASYILDRNNGYEWFNSAKRTVECTKNMMAVKAYSVLKQLGPQFFIDYLETCYDNGKLFAGLIRDHGSFELALEPKTNIVCFRYTDDSMDDDTLNRINLKARSKLVEDGRFYIVQTTIKNRTYLRTSLMNPFTGKKEMSGLLDHIINLIKTENE